MLNRLVSTLLSPRLNFAGDAWGGLAAMLVALPSAIAFGVIIYLPLGSSLAAEGAPAGMQQTAVFELQDSPFFGTANQFQAALESEEAFAFGLLDEALEWVETSELEGTAAEKAAGVIGLDGYRSLRTFTGRFRCLGRAASQSGARHHRASGARPGRPVAGGYRGDSGTSWITLTPSAKMIQHDLGKCICSVA